MLSQSEYFIVRAGFYEQLFNYFLLTWDSFISLRNLISKMNKMLMPVFFSHSNLVINLWTKSLDNTEIGERIQHYSRWSTYSRCCAGWVQGSRLDNSEIGEDPTPRQLVYLLKVLLGFIVTYFRSSWFHSRPHPKERSVYPLLSLRKKEGNLVRETWHYFFLSSILS